MQKLAEICIRRPVFATMIVLALTVVGAFSFGLLGVDRFPNVDLPIVAIITTNPGASPEEIEREISDRIEGAVNTVSGIEELRSTSSEGISQVVIQFQLGKNVDTAAAEVRQKVDLVLNELPKTADKPQVQKLNSDAADVLLYAVRSPRPLVAITEFADKEIVDQIESVSGVGSVRIFGGSKREIEVRVDSSRLRAYSLTVADLTNALRSQNMELPGGTVNESTRRLTVRTLGKTTDLSALSEIVVANREGYPVKLRDVAQVLDGGQQPTSVARQNGESAIVIGIQKQSGVNTVATIDAVKERIAELKANFPKDVQIDLVRDQSEFIRAALHSIEEHLIVGGFLAAGVVFVFLRNWRSTLIAAIAIPTSIIASFAVMKALGYTLNMMTMLALTLMVGVVIDDAIVVLENIYRFVEEKGMSPIEAAIEGTREIGLAVMATTLSLLAVFVPIGFMGGIVGQFMQSFGLTCAAAIAVSLIVSFTLTPTLAARWIKPNEKGHVSTDSALNLWLDRIYTRMLVWSMANRGKVVTLCALVIASIVPLSMVAGFTFIAEDDENEFEVSVRLPEGSSLAASESVMEDMARRIRNELEGVQSTLAVAGFNAQQQANAGTIFVRLKQISERKPDQKSLIAAARELLKAYPKNIYTSVQAVNPFAGGERNASIQFIIAGNDLNKLDQYSAQLLEHMKKDPNMADADRSLLPGKPELRLKIDRARAADLGVRVEDIASTINTMYSGERVNNFSEGKNQYEIRVRATAAARQDRDAVLRTMVPSTNGPVELRNVASISEGSGPGTIDRFNRQRQVTLYANPAPGGSQSAAVESIRNFVEQMNLDPGYRQAVSGDVKELEKTGFYFMIAVGLTFIFMYMVLAAQFESFIHPVTILLTLPLSVPFAMLSSALAGQQLNIFSMLGILLLFGVVKKNAILQIDHTNTLRAHGLPRDKAIIQANRDRLRPILMTTIALVAGMIPLVLGTGQGAETNRSIGVLVVGGQSLCLLLTLLAVPVFYSLFEDAKEWILNRRVQPIQTPAI
ncbi:MAG: efflux RND transporter permease subunit [Acidobacteria bacterium]|nr:efflux RND transporter permease subunit [Acidobacteriota bacterium]